MEKFRGITIRIRLATTRRNPGNSIAKCEDPDITAEAATGYANQLLQLRPRPQELTNSHPLA